MAASSVAIVNSTLIKIGSQPITSLSDTTDRAILANEQYDKCRRDLLYSHPWNFAIARIELALNATAPINEWDGAYDLTTTVLRVLQINNDSSIEWVVEGQQILCNETTCKIKYIKDITDTSVFSKAFEEVLALRIAYDLSFALTENATQTANLYKAYQDALRAARSFDAQEGSGPQVESDDFFNARL